jgi:signal transduction histidine kinase
MTELLQRVLDSEVPQSLERLPVRTAGGEVQSWDYFMAPLGRNPDGLRVVVAVASDANESADLEHQLEDVRIRLKEEVHRRTKDLNATIVALRNEIAEKERIGKALSLSRERLRDISRRTLNVLEADRRMVSKELHDSIGASLAAIKFSLEEKEIKRTQKGGHLEEPLDREIAYLVETIKETKRISANLRPTILDDLGLMATLKWYLRQFQRLYGNLQIHFNAEISEPEVPESMKIVIYRIVQEALTNAERHGDADQVWLYLRRTGDDRAISLTIEDNGRGFDFDEINAGKDPMSGYGLTAMRERCEIFGGTFRIDSVVDRGTRISARLPRNGNLAFSPDEHSS